MNKPLFVWAINSEDIVGHRLWFTAHGFDGLDRNSGPYRFTEFIFGTTRVYRKTKIKPQI